MLWLKAFHIIAVVCWFAGLFYLPRLFVYHVKAQDSTSRERFEIMERKLYRGIMTPSMVAVLTLGVWMLVLYPDFLKQHWMHAKLLLVACLVVYHFLCGRHRIQLAAGSSHHSERYFRIFNEVPVLFLIAIVILVVVKPF
jgi:putative membrane protein